MSAANYLWVNLDIGTYLETQGKDSTFIQDHYVDVKNTELIFPEQKRNLIYIFLESTEATFMGKEDGGAFDQNVIPELTEVARNNISFPIQICWQEVLIRHLVLRGRWEECLHRLQDFR